MMNALERIAWVLSRAPGAETLRKVLAHAEALRTAGLTPSEASFIDASRGPALRRLLGVRLGSAELRMIGRSEAYGNVPGELRVWWSTSESPPELRWSFSPSKLIELGPPGIPAALFAPKFELERNGMIYVQGADVDEWTDGSEELPSIAGTCRHIEVNRLPAASRKWTLIALGLDAGPALGPPNALRLPHGTFSFRRLAKGSSVVAVDIDLDAQASPDDVSDLSDALVWLLTFWAGRRVELPIVLSPETDAGMLRGGWGELSTRRWRLLRAALQPFLEMVLPNWWALAPDAREVYGIGMHVLSVVPWQPLEAQVVLCSAVVELFGSVIDIDDTATANPLKLSKTNKKAFNACLQESIEACMKEAADGAADPDFLRSKIDQVRNLALKPPQADLWKAIIEAHGLDVGAEVVGVNKTRNAIIHGRMTEPDLQAKIDAATFCRWAVSACILARIGYRGPVFDHRSGEDSDTSKWGLA